MSEFDEQKFGESASVPEGFTQDGDIADMEHFLKGSGVVVGGKIVNGDTLSQHFEHHGIPVSLLQPKDNDVELNERRKTKAEQQGIWGPFDMDEVDMDVLMQWSPTIQLQPADSDGQIPPEWILSLVNTTSAKKGERIEDPTQIIPKLPIRKSLLNSFSLVSAQQKGEDGKDYDIVKLRINPEKIVYPTGGGTKS